MMSDSDFIKWFRQHLKDTPREKVEEMLKDLEERSEELPAVVEPEDHFPEPFCGFKVPRFKSHQLTEMKIVYHVYSWHPRYPAWAMTCYDGPTEEEAWKILDRCGGMRTNALLMVKVTTMIAGRATYEVVGSREPADLRGWDPEHVRKVRERKGLPQETAKHD